MRIELASNNSIVIPWRFALLFALAFGVLMGAFEASRGTAFERFIVEDALLKPTNRLINVLWPADHVELVGRTFVSGTTRMHVTRGCEGVEMFLLLSAAIIVYPASAKRRLVGLLLGFVLAYLLSAARLAALVYTLRHAPNTWESLHGLVLPLAPVLAIAWYFLRWSSAVNDAQERAMPASNAA